MKPTKTEVEYAGTSRIRKQIKRYVPTATRRRDVPKPTSMTPNVNLHMSEAITHTSGIKYNGNPLSQMA